MRVYQFTVPYHKINGSFELVLAREFGGFTVVAGEWIWGAWLNAGKVVYERVAIYTVAVALLTDGVCLRERVRDFLMSIGEQAMYFAEIGMAQVEFLNVPAITKE